MNIFDVFCKNLFISSLTSESDLDICVKEIKNDECNVHKKEHCIQDQFNEVKSVNVMTCVVFEKLFIQNCGF